MYINQSNMKKKIFVNRYPITFNISNVAYILFKIGRHRFLLGN